jgi:DUF2075 family protein/DNA replication protein DnaC
MAKINAVKFDDDAPEELTHIEYGNDWPVVYVISGNDEAYVGETVNAAIRASQHLANPERRRLDEMNVISDSDFNKSVILDLESYLIKYMSSDGKFKLQNSNKGMQLHNYYDKLRYEENFAYIWKQLQKKSLAFHSIADIENSDLFKYSPYKALSFDQFIIVDSLVQALAEGRSNNEKSTLMVQGSAGTGKTVLAVYLTKLLTENAISSLYADSDFDADLNLDKMTMNLNKIGPIKVGLVIPMQSLRKTITKVFGNIRGLTKNMVISPVQVPRDHYDLLIVDEAHRLRQRKALAQYPAFDKNNKLLGFDNNGTELDWIMKCSDNQLFFYDSGQSVKPSDIDKSRFDELLNKPEVRKFTLTSQFRCEGGNDYIEYIRSIFSDDPPNGAKGFGNYELRLFDDVEEMIQAIRHKNDEFGLCRTVAGYSWKWKTKNKAGAGAYDIEIDGHRYLWNSDYVDWVNTPNSINEIGCIHTIQGYDLNYAGVILGNEIKYNRLLHQIEIDKSQYQDLQGKTALKDEEALRNYITNIYVTLMTRGIKGTYVFACDDSMKEYLRKYF